MPGTTIPNLSDHGLCRRSLKLIQELVRRGLICVEDGKATRAERVQLIEDQHGPRIVLISPN